MATIYVQEEGTEGDPEEFIAGRTLQDVAAAYNHNFSKPMKLKKKDQGYITAGLDMRLSELSSLGSTITGNGTADDPYVVHIVRSGGAGADAAAGATGGGEQGAGAGPGRLAAKMVCRPTRPPSAFAQYSVWHGAQEEACEADSPFLMPFLDYRTWNSEPPMPITLVDPALARICEAFSGKGQHGAAPTTAELLTVTKLTRMAAHFANEGERRDRFLAVMNGYLGGEGPLAVNKIGKFETDGTILVGGSEGMPIVILELKNKVGESGDPGPEGQDYYRRYLLDRADKPGTAKTVRDTPCPCLLLELMGPELRVSAMASTCDIQVLCQPLTPRLHLYDMFAADWEHMVAVAKVLRAIKFGAAELRQGYDASADASAARPAKRHRPSAAPGAANQPGQPLQRNPSLPLPYPLRPDSGCIASAKLPEPLHPPRQGCLLYRFWPAADAQSRLVKFVQRGSYGEAVHRAWAEQGLAPALYGVQQLAGGLCMVQMEELQGKAGWRSVAEIPPAERTEQLRVVVVGALQRAFTVEVGDGKRGVHGDARAANVLVRGGLTAVTGSLPRMQEQQGASGEEGEHQQPSPSPSQPGVDVARQQGPAATDIEVRFVDFDWAGIVGEAELPLWAVPRRALPPDRKLTTDYDLDVLRETWQLDFSTGVVQGAS